ncbi:hypothetical protein E2K93_12385 [Thalassotalea sp. HSM 43]|uniref:hypothetical protein n=1 Tax=Thalassotalea sp. HSM 43 TaxID=2552945 RepID=UPI0010807845|nr:hypothetical protein [Thalassotalea sp. HSM 43]QBY05130.1 hypothetical protein E2K93_12385 [Thalassotalea sp. HSM 43]
MIRTSVIAAALTLVSGCANVIDITIPLTAEMQNQSQLYHFKTPTWRVPDSVYNTQLSDIYAISNAQVSSREHKDGESKITPLHEDIDEAQVNLVLSMLNGDSAYFIKKQQVMTEQTFSFALSKFQQAQIDVTCDILSKDVNAQHLDKNGDALDRETTSEQRLSTTLSCLINQQDKQWQLTLNHGAKQELQVALKSEQQAFNVSGVDERIALVQGQQGIEKHSFPDFVQPYAGLNVFKDQQQLASISLVGDPKIWLKDDLTEDAKQVLLAASYGLTMYTWLDTEWDR